MASSIKKRGQKLMRKFSRASLKVSEGSKEHLRENLVEKIPNARSVRLLIFEWVLMIAALILLASTQAFWFGDSYGEEAFTSGGTYTEATIGEVDSLNPLFATTNSEKVLSKLLFSTLTAVDYSGHIGNQLAESVRAEEGGKRWILKLREGLKWSDGEALDNDDVIFTTTLIQNSAINSNYSSNLANVKVSENENGEIVFDLPVAYADFDAALNIPILPKHILENVAPDKLLESDFSTTPTVTSGAFTFNAVQAGTGENEKIYYLKRNENYYAGETLLNGFAVHTFSTAEEVAAALNAGTVTASAELSGTETALVTNSGLIRRDAAINSGAFIFFNLSRTNVSQKSVRTAIRQGLDLTAIRAVAEGTAELDFPLLSSQIALNYPELPATDFEVAKSSLDSIFGENFPELAVATVNSGYLPEVTEVLKTELEELGFSVSVTIYEEGQDFLNNVIANRNYDLLVYTVELGAEPDLIPYYHSSQATSAGLNLSNYKNFLVNDLLLGARETLDESLRASKYEKFLEYFVADVPAIGLYQANMTYFYNQNVRTFGNNVRLVTATDRFADILDWAVEKTGKNKTP